MRFSIGISFREIYNRFAVYYLCLIDQCSYFFCVSFKIDAFSLPTATLYTPNVARCRHRRWVHFRLHQVSMRGRLLMLNIIRDNVGDVVFQKLLAESWEEINQTAHERIWFVTCRSIKTDVFCMRIFQSFAIFGHLFNFLLFYLLFYEFVSIFWLDFDDWRLANFVSNVCTNHGCRDDALRFCYSAWVLFCYYHPFCLFLVFKLFCAIVCCVW